MVSQGNGLPTSSIPIFTTVDSYRTWRQAAFSDGKTVGFVATMGALHEGHLSLVRRSLAENDHTVVSIFVNPAQFAPHEDLATYPRTLPTDLKLLERERIEAKNASSVKITSAVFAPTVTEMYPSGIDQNVSKQKGTFVEVKGYGHQMEGTSRPTFFRGVATVVTKLFNVIQPTRTYFGQKDIQQALLLKRMARDLLLSHPTPDNLIIVPTTRDPVDGLAMSSRNSYLSAQGRTVAPTLRRALLAAEQAWSEGSNKDECIDRAISIVKAQETSAISAGLEVSIRLDYIEMNDAATFEPLESHVVNGDFESVILSGALNVDKTRLIDNIFLGDAVKAGISV